ncbi:MAG: TetR/AcrR family transcriptional regulator [Pseudomonadota bacterium]
MADAPRPRGRPRSFDTGAAMTRIVDVFRTFGLDAASLDDISAATGLSRPSLYAAFGNKTALYLSAMEAFSLRVTDQAALRLSEDGSVEAVLTDFFEAIVDLYAPTDGSALGCLVWGTAPAAVHSDEVRTRLAVALSELDVLFMDVVQSADRDDTARAAAELLANTVMGVSTRARAGADPDEIRAHTRRVAKFIAAGLQA